MYVCRYLACIDFFLRLFKGGRDPHDTLQSQPEGYNLPTDSKVRATILDREEESRGTP